MFDGFGSMLFCIFIIAMSISTMLGVVEMDRRFRAKMRRLFVKHKNAVSALKNNSRRDRLVAGLSRLVNDPGATNSERANAKARLVELGAAASAPRPNAPVAPPLPAPFYWFARMLVRAIYGGMWRAGVKIDSERFFFIVLRALCWTVAYGYLITLSAAMERVMVFIMGLTEVYS